MKFKSFGYLVTAVCAVFSTHSWAQTADIQSLLATSDAASRLQSVSWTATGDFFDTAQAEVAGSRGRHASTYDVEGSWRPGEGADYSWTLHTHYPFPSDWTYSEQLIAGDQGSLTGVDGFRPTPEGPIPLARTAARAKLLWMSTPAMLLSQSSDVTALSGRPNAVSFHAVNTEWTVQLDGATGFPVRVSTTEADPFFGSVEVSMDYFAWTEVGGVFMPARLEYRVDGQLNRRETRSNIEIELTSSAEGDRQFDPPMDGRFGRGWTSAHWFISRIALGAPADNDESRPAELLEVADGIYQVIGSSHHSLVIEASDQLAVVDAPLYPERSEAVLEALRERWPDKPVTRLILTHHHLDHSGGVVTYAAAGIPVTVHAANYEFFFNALSDQGLGAPKIDSVGEAATIMVGDREIGLYDIPTVHVAGILAVHVPDQALLFNADLYSPGRPTQHPVWSLELLRAVQFLDLDIELHVGAHGYGAETMADLERLVAGQQ